MSYKSPDQAKPLFFHLKCCNHSIVIVVAALLQPLITITWNGFKPCDLTYGVLAILGRSWMPGGLCAICFGLSGLKTQVISPTSLKIFIISLVIAKWTVIVAMWSCNGAGKHISTAFVVLVIICVRYVPNIPIAQVVRT